MQPQRQPLHTEAKKPLPATRKMTIMAQDPSVRSGGRILMSTISVPAEDLIAGPKGYRVHVIDYDSTKRLFNGSYTLPASLDGEPAAWKNGDLRIVDDFTFHAYNVYALVMKTLARFEFALGRRIGWSFETHQLYVAPHGVLDANAFYSPDEQGLVFGYFTGRDGKPVDTCLSHDVVVHETTHALIDALRERYLDPSSPDQAAFHEGFADVIALLSVFSQGELVQELLVPGSAGTSSRFIERKELTPARLRETALFGLAEQMGQEMRGVRGDALRRSATLPPNPDLILTPEFEEPHRRGEILVAAVLSGFIEAWSRRILSSGTADQKQYPTARVAEEGAGIADALVTMWIRALDYMPPVHVEFSDALSAALTADLQVRPDDSRFQLRRHMRESFRAYGIAPASNRDAEGIWLEVPHKLSYDRVRFDSMRSDKDEVFRFIWENRRVLGLREAASTRVLSVRPCVHIGADGFVLHETVAEYYQFARLTPEELAEHGIHAPKEYLKELTQPPPAPCPADGSDGNGAPDVTTPLYGGGTLVFDEYGKLKYHIHNDVFSKLQSGRLRYLWQAGLLAPGKEESRLQASRLSTIHRLRSMDARQWPAEKW